MMKKGNVIIDLSNTSDFTANGDNAMNAYYAKIIETRSFGTHSQNLLVILSKTGVTADFVTKWATIFQKDKKIVLLNLSENSSVDDSVIDALPAIFPKLYSLNLAYTNVTDIGISKIVALLETHGIGMLTCITLTGSKTSESGVASLKLAIQKAVELWKVKNPGKEYPLEGDGGIIFKKPQFTAKVKARKNPTPNLNLPTSIEVPEETAVATISDISPVTSEITQSDEPTQEQVLETLNDVDKIIAENSSTTTEQNVDSIDSSQVSGTLLS
jgi:hypothetical protein